jgi:hypothetical protein
VAKVVFYQRIGQGSKTIKMCSVNVFGRMQIQWITMAGYPKLMVFCPHHISPNREAQYKATEVLGKEPIRDKH